MADDPWAEFNPQPAPKTAAPANDPWAEFNPQPAPKPEERSVLQRAGEAIGEQFKSGVTALARPFAGFAGTEEEAKKRLREHQGFAGAWKSAKEAGETLLSPLTILTSPLAGVESVVSSGVGEAQRATQKGVKAGVEYLSPEIGKKLKAPQTSEEAYEAARPGVSAATMAIGRMPGVAGTGKFPMPDFQIAGSKKVPAQTMEGEAGRYLEGKARDPATLRQKLDQPIEEIAGPGDKPSTFQHTGEFGQLERRAARSESHSEEFLDQKAAQNAARQRTLEGSQPTGDPMAPVNELRAAMEVETRAADTAAAQAAQRAQQLIEAEGGRISPDTYGAIFRRELEIAEEGVRVRERELWQQVDPDGTLRSNPQPIQELERRVYGNLPQAASLTAEETRLAGVIQNYRPNIPFRELTALRSEVSGALRNELYTNGQTPAYARLSQLRRGIEEAIPRSFGPAGEAAGVAAAERLRAASTATRERVERFRPTRAITRKEGTEGPYKLEDVSTIPEKIIASGTRGYDRVGQYLRAVGVERGLPELTDAVVARMRREVIGVNGEVNPRKLEGFMRRYQDTFRAIDAADGGALSARMRNIQTAQETIETATANRAAVAKKYSDDQFRALTGATNETDATNMIANIFGKQDSVARAQELMRRLTTPEAREGARAAVVRHIRERLTSNAQLGEDLLLRAEQFQTWVNKNNAALRQILAPEQVQNLENIARSMRRANQSNQTKAIGGGSDTYQMQQAGAAQQGVFKEIAGLVGPTALRGVIHAITGTLGGFPGMAASGAADIAISRMLTKRAARKAATEEGRIAAVQELIDDALLDPEKMRALLKKTYTYKSTGMPGAKKATAYGAAVAGTQAGRSNDQKRVPRQAGGGVPAIGGTGGRSPGARAASQAGAARKGAGQALPNGGATGDVDVQIYADGGEVSQPVVEAKPPGLRERHAAMLTGTPASGPSFERLATTRKGPAALSREDIRKTLQSFGVSGEAAGGFSDRQLGERVDVDSRAEGGAVFDPEGSDYDMESAKAGGLEPDETGHWGSRVPSTGLILKGRGHPTYSKTEEGEAAAGYEIRKGGDGRYYSQPRFASGGAVSRATGGGVDDPTGERAPIHYDPGDDTTFGARFGQWDQTATGKSLPRDDEDVDSTIMVPGQRMIDPLGHRGVRGRAGYYETRGMAEGGSVNVDSRGADRWADIPESQNVEDRRDEEPLTPGQLIAANQAFMGHYPSPYTRASRKPATAGPASEADVPPDVLLAQTRKYVADQLAGVEDHHEKQDPAEAAIQDMGGFEHPQGEGGSDEGKLPLRRADGGEIDWEEDKLPLPGQSRGLRSTAGPTITSTMPEEEIPAPKTNKAGETLPTHILRSWGTGLADLAKTPGRVTREGMTEEDMDFGPQMGSLMTFGPLGAARGSATLTAGMRRSGGRRPPPTPPPELHAGEVPAADRPVSRSHNMPPEELPEELPPAPLPPKRATASLGLRDMPLDQAIAAAKTERHVIPSNPKVREGYVGAPDWVKTPEDLARLRADFDAQVERGLTGAKWYQEAQGGIKEMAGPDPKRQHRLSQELALTSAQSTPDTNLGFALQGHNAIMAGKPLDIVRTGQQADTLREGIKSGEIHLGRKTGIYARHMDPTMENPSTGTNDIWHARALGYENPEGGMGMQEHAFMDAETVLAVARANEKKLGGRSDWTPGEIQAAPWVAGKAEGLQEQFGWSPEKAMAEAVKTYPHHFNKYTAFGTHEATPGVGTGHLPGVAEGTAGERARFAEHPASFWRDPSGRDLLYQGLDMWTRPSVKSTGVYEGPKGLEVNPAEVARPMVGFAGKAGERVVDPASRHLMNAAEAARAYVDVQNAGAWSIPIRNQKTGLSTSAYVSRPGGGPLPIGDVGKLQAIGGRNKLPGVIDYGEGTALTSFGDGPTGKELSKGLRGGLGSEIEGVLGGEPAPVRLDSGYIDYQSLWGEKAGSGAVTRELQKYLAREDAPDIIKRFDASPELRRSVAAKMERDAEIAAQTGQPIRGDVQLARKIIVEEGFEGLFAALKRGAALPAVAFAPLVELFAQLGNRQDE